MRNFIIDSIKRDYSNNFYYNADCVVFYDSTTNKLCALNVEDIEECNYDNISIINRISDFNKLGSIEFVNIDDFIIEYPNSCICKYITDEHSPSFYANTNKYVAAYIYMYRCYESFDTLVANDHTKLIDSFLEYAMEENVEHPGTLAYFKKEQIHEALRLKKYVYNIFKVYLYDYKFYAYLIELQNSYNYREKDFRKLRNKIKNSLEFDYLKPEKNSKTKSGLKLIA